MLQIKRKKDIGVGQKGGGLIIRGPGSISNTLALTGNTA